MAPKWDANVGVGPLAHGNDEIRALAGLALVDALVGDDDGAAGRQSFGDPRHGILRDRDAIERFCRIVRDRHRLCFNRRGWCALLPSPGHVLMLLAAPRACGRWQ